MHKVNVFLIAVVFLSGCMQASVKEKETITITSYFSQQDIEDIVEIVLDELPEATGRELPYTPAIKFVSSDELKTVLVEKRSAPEEDLAKQQKKDKELDQYVKSVSGIYEPSSQVIYIIPDNFKLYRDKRERIEQEAYYRLFQTITHEMIHALQFSNVDFNHIYPRHKTQDERRALRITIEGHAELLTAMVLKRIGLIEEIEDYISSSDNEIVFFEDDEDKQYKQSLAEIYHVGKRFFDYHYRQGGNELVWKILANPPKNSDAVINPESYKPGIAAYTVLKTDR